MPVDAATNAATYVLERAAQEAYHVLVRRFSSLLADARQNQLKGKRNPLWLMPSGLFHLRVADLPTTCGRLIKCR
jgi:hypothetical protein